VVSGGSNNVDFATTATPQYSSLIAQVAPSTTSTNGNATASISGTLSNFSVVLSGTPGGGNSYTFTVRVNGVATALTCNATGTTCSSDAFVSVTAGDTINVEIVANSTPTARNADWSATYAWGVVPIA
jgi:hypothetical protein